MNSIFVPYYVYNYEWIFGKGRYRKEFVNPYGIKAYRTEYEEVTYKDHNIIPIGGYQYAFSKLFNIAPDQDTTLRVGDLNDEAPQMKIGVPRGQYSSIYYNYEVHGQNSSNNFTVMDRGSNTIGTPPRSGINISALNFIFGFMVGDGASRNDNLTPIAPNYKDRGLFRAIPFRMSNDNSSNIDTMKYFGRTTQINTGGTDITSYYIKKFDSPAPSIIHCWVTDNPNELEIVDDTVFSSTSSVAIESYVEINISISDEDCRGFFKATDSTPRINELALVSGWYNNGYEYDSKGNQLGLINDYEQIRLFSKFTRPSISLTDGDAIEATYRLYAR